MIPLLKIRLMKIKRNFVQNLLQFLYPPILMAIVAIIYLLIPKDILSVSDKPFQSEPVSYSFADPLKGFNKISSLALICNNTKLRLAFREYVKKYMTIPVSILDPYIVEFDYYKNFTDYIDNIDYTQLRYLSAAIYIEESEGNIKFSVQDGNFTYTAIDVSTNILDLDPIDEINSNKDTLEPKIAYQVMLTNFVLSYYNKKDEISKIELNTLKMQIPPIENALSSGGTIYILPVLVSITYSSTLFALLLWMVSEKEHKLVDFLNRQGISQSGYILSWLLTYLALTIIPTIITTTILRFCMMYHVNYFILLGYQIIYTISIFASSFFFHSFIDRTQTGDTLVKILFIGISVFSIVVMRTEIPLYVKLIFSIFPQITQVYNYSTFLKLDNLNASMDWFLFTAKHNKLSLFDTLIIYIVMIVVYMLLGIFITNYRKSGLDFCSFIGKPCAKKKRSIAALNLRSDNTIASMESNFEINHQEISPQNAEMKKQGNYLHIHNICKNFGDLRAVDNFNGEIYSNEIFCLLGHNGAGKTTLISMISGIQDPDNGDIFLGATSLVTNKDYLYKNIGLCAQDDIFFDYLTVEEHLYLMSELKGQRATKEEVNTLMTELGLQTKKDAASSTLSGGQKRKLCIAIALIGNSKLILLDEPTSGMDVVAKKGLWQVLKRFKTNKIIILTTHSLDEAEYLGDRIGIMSEGHFLCSGTSSYLKSKYPCGYNVNCIIDPNRFTEQNKYKLIGELREIDASSCIKIASKIVLSINFSGVGQTTEQIFKHIDSVKNDIGIENYTVSTTTLEDVFLKVNTNEVTNDLFNVKEPSQPVIERPSNENAINTDTASENLLPKVENLSEPIPIQGVDNFVYHSGASCPKQFCSNFIRYLIPLWRNKSNFIFELIAAAALLFVYIIGVSALMQSSDTELQSLDTLIGYNTIYYKVDPELNIRLPTSNYVKNVLQNKIKLVELSDEFDIHASIKDYDTKFYEKDKYKTQRNIIVLRYNNSDKTKIEILNLYQAASPDYLLASNNILLSEILEVKINKQITLMKAYSKMPSGIRAKITESSIKLLLSIVAILLLWNSFLSLGSYVMLQPLRERITNVKHLIFLSGGNMFSYWLGMLFVDMIKFAFFLAIICPLFLYLSTVYAYCFIIFVPFSIAMILFSYMFSFIFDKEENGPKWFFLVGLILSITLPGVTVYRLFKTADFYSYAIDWRVNECDLIPTSSLLYAMIRIVIVTTDSSGFIQFVWQVIANHCAIFAGQIVLYSLILFLFQSRIIGSIVNSLLNCLVYKNNNQLPVLNANEPMLANQPQQQVNYNQLEQEKISQKRKDLTTMIIGLKKTFFVCCGRNVRAVNRLYLGLEPNEKFGLLGFNGSGKTTTFKAITNEIFFDEGSIELFGFNVKNQFQSVRQFIGYCPQANAMFDHLTVEETINFYKSLKSIQEPTEEICRRFGLGKYLKTISTKLSGGNKRKLTFACALMHHPKILLLDEPSTGVDPESRRIMWKNINDLNRTGNAYNMILTTHSMEEAEILCDTVSWLRNGSFVCVGNAEKLKLQFSAGYKLHIKFNAFENVDEASTVPLNARGEVQNLVDCINQRAVTDPLIKGYYHKLTEVVADIRPSLSNVFGSEIGQDYSFELIIQILPDKQGELFSQILNMKNNHNDISEISINMESLENILTRQ